MPVLVIRHGLSQANNRENIGSPAFGHRDAELMDLGREQARNIPVDLLRHFGIVDTDCFVATSTLLRTIQTATEAGFAKQHQYSQLDEVEHKGLEGTELRAMLRDNQLPPVALTAAAVTLEKPPTEKVWFTHGLRIAGLCALLGVHRDERLIPRFCEIRELPI
jgi:hypothetical protein